MMICGFDSNKVSKSFKFCRRENQLSPSVGTCMAIKYGSKLVHFIRMRVPIYMILNITMNIFKRVNEKKALRINISYLIGRTSTMLLYVKGQKMHMLSVCSIFIINASLWKTLQATLLF